MNPSKNSALNEKDLKPDKETDLFQDKEKDLLQDKEKDLLQDKEKDLFQDKEKDLFQDKEKNLFPNRMNLLEKMSCKELETLLSCLLPIAVIDDLQYMIGVEAKSVFVESDRPMIETSSGYIDLKDFLESSNLASNMVIWRIIQEKKLTYKEAVLSLLYINGVVPDLISEYDREINDDISGLFADIASLIKQTGSVRQTTDSNL